MPDDVLRLRATVVNEEALAELRELGREIGLISTKGKPAVTGIKKEFQALTEIIKGLSPPLVQAGFQLASALRGVGTVVGGVAAVIGASVATVVTAAKRINELRLASKELGMSERDIRAWGVAAEKAGSSAESMTASLARVKDTVDGLKFGLSDAFKEDLYSHGGGMFAEALKNAKTADERMQLLLTFIEKLKKQDPSGALARHYADASGLGRDKADLTYEDYLKAKASRTPISKESQREAQKITDQLADAQAAMDELHQQVGGAVPKARLPARTGRRGRATGAQRDLGSVVQDLLENLGDGGEAGPAGSKPLRFGDYPFGPPSTNIEDRRGASADDGERVVKKGVLAALIDFQSYTGLGDIGGLGGRGPGGGMGGLGGGGGPGGGSGGSGRGGGGGGSGGGGGGGSGGGGSTDGSGGGGVTGGTGTGAGQSTLPWPAGQDLPGGTSSWPGFEKSAAAAGGVKTPWSLPMGEGGSHDLTNQTGTQPWPGEGGGGGGGAGGTGGTGGISPEGMATLDTIASGEAEPAFADGKRAGWNTAIAGFKFDPNTPVNPPGSKYSGLDISGIQMHPHQAYPGWKGFKGAAGTSYASGRYQETTRTYYENVLRSRKLHPGMKVEGWSEEAQNIRNWDKAQEIYKSGAKGISGLTGDLQADVQANRGNPAKLAQIASAMHGEWTSLPGGTEGRRHSGGSLSKYAGVFQQALQRVGTAGQAATASTASTSTSAAGGGQAATASTASTSTSAAGGGTQYDKDLAFIKSRGGHEQRKGATREPGGLDPQMASRLRQAGEAYEKETGKRAIFGETFRDRTQQEIYYQEYLRNPKGGLAAPPGKSLHELGIATDIPLNEGGDKGAFNAWMHQRKGGGRFGLTGIRGDQPHIQMVEGRKYRNTPYVRPAGEGGGVAGTDGGGGGGGGYQGSHPYVDMGPTGRGVNKIGLTFRPGLSPGAVAPAPVFSKTREEAITRFLEEQIKGGDTFLETYKEGEGRGDKGNIERFINREIRRKLAPGESEEENPSLQGPREVQPNERWRSVSTDRIDGAVDTSATGGAKAEGSVNVHIQHDGTRAKAKASSKGALFQKTQVQTKKQMQPTSEPAAPMGADQ
jgi:hypothetical protein